MKRSQSGFQCFSAAALEKVNSKNQRKAQNHQLTKNIAGRLPENSRNSFVDLQ